MKKNLTFIFDINKFENPSDAHFFEHLFLIRTKNYIEKHEILISLDKANEEDILYKTYPDKYVEVTIRNLTSKQIKTVIDESKEWYFNKEDFELEKRVFEIEREYVELDYLDNCKNHCFDTIYVNDLAYENTKERYLKVLPKINITNYFLSYIFRIIKKLI